MGFRNGAYATIWEIKVISDTMVRARISTSRKNKKTNEYETDFSGFVCFLGTVAAKKASSLKERDRIKIESADVTTSYNKEKKISYTNFNIFEFEIMDNSKSNNESPHNSDTGSGGDEDPGNGEVDDSGLPF